MSLEQRYTALVSKLEKVDEQEKELNRLKAELARINSGAGGSVGAGSSSAPARSGLSPEQAKHIKSEIIAIKAMVKKLESSKAAPAKAAPAPASGGSDFEKLRTDVLGDLVKFRKAVAQEAAEKTKLLYRIDILKKAYDDATKKPIVRPFKNKVEAVIFDCDGLLVDSEPWWRQAEKELFATVGIKLTEQDCIETTGMRIREIVAQRYGEKPWDADKISEYELTRQIESRVAELIRTKAKLKPGVEHAVKFFDKNLGGGGYMTEDTIKEGKYYSVTTDLGRLKKAWADADLEEMDDDFFTPLLGMKVRAIDIEEDETVNCRLDNNFDSQYIPISCLMGGTPVLFAVCSSSCTPVINAALSLMPEDLRAVFKVIQSCEDLEHAKPHPQGYLETAQKLKVNPRDCIALEDSFRGCLSALSAGMRTIAVPECKDTSKFACANVVLKSLKEISKETLKKLA